MNKNVVMLIPSLEPDQRLISYVNELLSNGFRKVVIVDDGSSNEYQGIFNTLSQTDGCVVLHHEVNRGKGAALKTGYAYIKESIKDCFGVITADADGQHAVKDCLKLAECLIGNDKAFYLGSRDFNLKNVPPKSRFGNKTTSLVFKLLYGTYLPDTQTGLRAFSIDEIDFMMGVEGQRFEYEMNVLIDCAQRKYPMVPITINTIYENENAGTHFHPIKDSIKIYKVIFKKFFKFMGTSLLCFVLDWLLAAILGDWLLPKFGMTDILKIAWISGLGARLVSATLNFVLNKNLVFKVKSGKNTALKYAFLCVLIISLSNTGTYLMEKFLTVTRWLCKGVCDVLLYFLSYRIQGSWVFKSEK